MTVIVNEVEVIVDPPTPEDIKSGKSESITSSPTPHDIYWVTRKLLERRSRLYAR